MTKVLDQQNFQFLFDKKSDFSIVYKHGGCTINFVGKAFRPTSYYSLPDKAELINNCHKWYIDIHIMSKKQDGLLQVFEAGTDEKKEMFCTLVLDEFSFGRLEANLTNNGRDFLEKLIIQISLSEKQLEKLKEGSNIHSLKILESSIYFNAANRDND